MDLKALTVYASPFPKTRIGKPNDGGYIVADVPNAGYDLCLAGGVCDDLSFEEHFCSLHDGVQCYAFDGTVDSPPPFSHPRLHYIKQNIGPYNTSSMTDLKAFLDVYANVFVKHDIEGYEIPWFDCLTPFHMDRISQMVVEFHFPFSEIETRIFKKINLTHVLIHFHPNNNCGTRIVDGIEVPNVFECTYLHKKHFTQTPSLSRDPVPGPLDMPNVTQKPDIFLTTPPFVHSS